MIRIERDCLYSRADLSEMLNGSGIDVDTFIARLKPRKVFKALYYGADLLKALDEAPALKERTADRKAPPKPRNKGGRRPSKSEADRLGPLRELMK